MLRALDLRPGPRRLLDARRRELADLRFERIALRPLAPTLGAEIAGVDLADLDDAGFAEIERAFLAYNVVLFRDQDLSVEDQLAFARRS